MSNTQCTSLKRSHLSTQLGRGSKDQANFEATSDYVFKVKVIWQGLTTLRAVSGTANFNDGSLNVKHVFPSNGCAIINETNHFIGMNVSRTKFVTIKNISERIAASNVTVEDAELSQ